MESASTASIKASRALMLAVYAALLFHAATAPVNADEAQSFNRAIGLPLTEMFHRYDPSNDVLYTWLAKCVLSSVRLAEWSLRLPAMAGAALYFWAAYRLSRRLFGAGLLFLAAVALLVLPPVLIHHLAEARGAGLALAFWMWAFVFLLEDVKPENLKRAGVALGLSVAAQLSFVFPAIGLAVAGARGRLKLCLMAAMVTAFILLALPLSHADRPVAAAAGFLLRGWRLAAIPLVAAAFWSGKRAGRWMATTALITFLLLVAARWTLGAPYPAGGSAVYWVPLLTLCALCAADRIGPEPAAIALLALAAWYAIRFPLPLQAEPAAPRELAKALRKDAGSRPVRVAAASDVAPVLEFYRTRYGQRTWTIVDAKSDSGPFDYVVFGPADRALAEGPGLRVLYRGGGLVLAH